MKKGFTLVELSIVLVIIGLLIGGILVGQSLIESVKIQKSASQITQFRILIHQFKDRFRYYPGDLPNAYNLFGGQCTGNYLKAGIPFQTAGCNGNGDGSVSAAHPAEADNFLKHLSLSGIYNKELSEFYVDQDYVLGGNVPETPFDGVYLAAVQQNNGYSYSGKQDYVLGMQFKTDTPKQRSFNAITPAQLYAIDKKLDDGLSNSGFVYDRRVGFNPETTCSEGRTTGRYKLENSDVSCAGVFFEPKEYQ